MLRAAVIVLWMALLPSPLRAEARIALLIGNEAYATEIGRLANPHNDVALLEQALKRLGFEVVTLHDAGLGSLYQAVNAYARRLQAAGSNAIGFFYYSGHGASDGSTNYLIPVDVKSKETGELWDESLRLTEITRKLKAEAGNAAHFVVFDACRNTLKLTQPGSRAVVQSKGFVPVAQENGMLIAYATAEGELASDVGAGAGPYAKVLAEEIVKPGIEAVVMFRAVQRRVRAAIRQEPYLGFNALGDVYLAGRSDVPISRPAAPTVAQPQLSEASQAWALVMNTTDIPALEAFRRQYGAANPFFDRLAETRVEELKRQQVATAGSPASKPLLPNLLDKTLGIVLPPPPSGNCDGVEIVVGQNERRCFKPGAGKTEQFKDCPTCPEMVVIPAGTFTMGSPANEPQRSSDEVQVRVSIAAPFAVGKYAVTFDEWDACVAGGGCNGYKPVDQGWGRGKRPVIFVNWDDAKAYMAWLSHKTGKTYRLLSEAEREYVTRAGTTTPFWWGSSIMPEQANYKDGGRWPGTVPVDAFDPNPWGLNNVHGNVWEWTEDCWNDTNIGNPGDGLARTRGNCSKRVVRGGSWIDGPPFLRSADRLKHSADLRDYGLGFRLARTLAP
jgi:formylglycine-generating enzyme required for sulfatase activity